MPDYLFVCGCPRSGTTLIAELLNAHSRIALGIERYGFRFFSEPLTPELFQPDRFYDLQPGDTFYPSLDFSRYYDEKRTDFHRMAYVGDKIPMLYDHLSSIRTHFPKAKIVFCLRNILDVASSFQTRRDNPEDVTWSDTLDGVSAVDLWNASIVAYAAHRQDMDIFVFRHSSFVRDGKRQVRRMIRWLGLDWTEALARIVDRHLVVGERKQATRKLNLTGAAKHKIADEAAFDGYRKIMRQRVGRPGASHAAGAETRMGE